MCALSISKQTDTTHSSMRIQIYKQHLIYKYVWRRYYIFFNLGDKGQSITYLQCVIPAMIYFNKFNVFFFYIYINVFPVKTHLPETEAIYLLPWRSRFSTFLKKGYIGEIVLISIALWHISPLAYYLLVVIYIYLYDVNNKLFGPRNTRG